MTKVNGFSLATKIAWLLESRDPYSGTEWLWNSFCTSKTNFISPFSSASPENMTTVKMTVCFTCREPLSSSGVTLNNKTPNDLDLCSKLLCKMENGLLTLCIWETFHSCLSRRLPVWITYSWPAPSETTAWLMLGNDTKAFKRWVISCSTGGISKTLKISWTLPSCKIKSQ